MFTTLEFTVSDHDRDHVVVFQLRADFKDATIPVQACLLSPEWHPVRSATGDVLTSATINSVESLVSLGYGLAPNTMRSLYRWAQPKRLRITYRERNDAKLEMVAMLKSHGDTATQGIPERWLEEGFTAETAKPWVAIGLWCPETAKDLADRGVTPAKVSKVSAQLGTAIHMLCTGYLDLSVVEQWLD